MLTVRVKQMSGIEIITPAREFQVMPNPNGMTSDSKIVCFKGEGDTSFRLDTGDVYVMNDSGKTVAIYNLGSDMPITVTTGFDNTNSTTLYVNPRFGVINHT